MASSVKVSYGEDLIKTIEDSGKFLMPTAGKTVKKNITLDVELSGAVPENDVIFIDYDGTVLYEYGKDDFLALSALPENPTHTGLTSQGWNWSLADAQEVVGNYGKLNIGQMYNTSDGKTRVYITLPEGRLHPYVGFGLNGTATIDWGDSSSTSSATGSSGSTVVYTDHTYSSAGDYVITIDHSNVSDFTILGESNATRLLCKSSTASANDDAVYSNSITKVEVGSGAIIGNYAFSGCSSLETITLPSGMTSIGTYAFDSCYNLVALTLPSSLTTLGDYVCTSCSFLEVVAFGSGLTTLGAYAFQYCDMLKSVTLVSEVENISNYAFYTCRNLESVTMSDGVTTIGDHAFDYCYSLKSIYIPDATTSIGESAFNACYQLTSVTLADSLTTIGANAFYACYSLKEIEIPNAVTNIGNSAFRNCSVLDTISVGTSVTTISTYAFASTAITSITLPESVTTMWHNIFERCYQLRTVVLPNHLEALNNYVFQYCKFSTIILPDSLKSIGNYTFQFCYDLTKITIPSLVTSIGSYAFRGCTGLAEIHFLPATPPTVTNSNAWTNIPTDCKIYVPTGTLSAYTSASNYPSSSTYTYIEE